MATNRRILAAYAALLRSIGDGLLKLRNDEALRRLDRLASARAAQRSQ